MVVGNGLLASAFSHYENDDQVIIFASGVSNSKETNEKEFEREELLLKNMSKDKILIYFSTCSVYDPSTQGSQYVRHKMHMERLIHMYFENYIVFRLPIIVGITDNPNTFFNYFKNKIIKGDELTVQILASRHLIDIEDVKNILTLIIDKEKQSNESFRKKIDVGFDNEIRVVEIVDMMLDILEKNNKINIEGHGSNYTYPIQIFEEYLKEFNYNIRENYTYNLLKKYLLCI